MSAFDEFLGNVKSGIFEIAKKTIIEHKDQAFEDGKSFIEDTKQDLERWTKLLAKGEISKEEFLFLLKGKQDLFKLNSLTQAGLALIAAQKFRDAVIELVIDTAVDVFI